MTHPRNPRSNAPTHVQVSSRASVEATELDVAKQIMTVNYFGPVGLSKALLAARGRGDAGGRSAGIHFVVVNSVQGKFGIAFRSSYTASKHALVGFFDCLRAETSHLGVRVTSVFPGYIRTKYVFTGGKAGQSVRYAVR